MRPQCKKRSRHHGQNAKPQRKRGIYRKQQQKSGEKPADFSRGRAALAREKPPQKQKKQQPAVKVAKRQKIVPAEKQTDCRKRRKAPRKRNAAEKIDAGARHCAEKQRRARKRRDVHFNVAKAKAQARYAPRKGVKHQRVPKLMQSRRHKIRQKNTKAVKLRQQGEKKQKA